MRDTDIEFIVPNTERLKDYQVNHPYMLSRYDAYADRLHIDDAVWGECEIGNEPGDEVFLALLDNDLVRRSMSIAQLTMAPQFETLPGVADMSRWEHVWGSVALTRAKLKDMDVDPAERVILQLRTFLSDLGHTAFSHLGDWIFQGVGGPENMHDEDLPMLLEAGGVNDILRQHDIDPKHVISEEANDWIECPQPDLCVDRVDYGARQIKRCFPAWTFNATKPEAFAVDDHGRMVMTSERRALEFAKAFALLPTEHFAEPVRRMLLLLKQEMVKRLFVLDEPLVSNWMHGPSQYHPRDYMYTVDWDMLVNMQTVDPFIWAVSEIMEDTARAQRRYFSQVRDMELARYLEQDGQDFPVPGKGTHWRSRYHPGFAPNVQIIPVNEKTDIKDFKQNPLTLDFELRPLKPRAVDPLFITKDGSIKRLSETNRGFARNLTEQAQVCKQSYVARLLVSPDYRKVIEDGINENAREWPELLKRPRMPSDKLASLISEVGRMSSSNLIRLNWYR